MIIALIILAVLLGLVTGYLIATACMAYTMAKMSDDELKRLAVKVRRRKGH